MLGLLRQRAMDDLIAIEDKKFLDAVKAMMPDPKPEPCPVEAMIAVLESPQGFDIELFGALTIGRYENGEYAVNYRPHGQTRPNEYLFEKASEALDKFFELRDQHHLGYDYETAF